MRRPARIALNILMPPLLAACCFLVAICVDAVGDFMVKPQRAADGLIGVVLQFGLYAIFIAYLIAGLPSILHAGLMELAYRRFAPNRWAAVGLSTLSGTFAGTLITIFYANGNPTRILNKALFVGLGAFVGFLLGVFIKWRSPSGNAPSTRPISGCE